MGRPRHRIATALSLQARMRTNTLSIEDPRRLCFEKKAEEYELPHLDLRSAIGYFTTISILRLNLQITSCPFRQPWHGAHTYIEVPDYGFVYKGWHTELFDCAHDQWCPSKDNESVQDCVAEKQPHRKLSGCGKGGHARNSRGLQTPPQA